MFEDISNEEKELLQEYIPMLRVANDIKKHLAWGQITVTSCPLCSGKLEVRRDSYNGHTHVVCKQCGKGLHV